MGHRQGKYLKKVKQQLINRNENKEYYQNSTEWHTPSTDRELSDRRKVVH